MTPFIVFRKVLAASVLWRLVGFTEIFVHLREDGIDAIHDVE